MHAKRLLVRDEPRRPEENVVMALGSPGQATLPTQMPDLAGSRGKAKAGCIKWSRGDTCRVRECDGEKVSVEWQIEGVEGRTRPTDRAPARRPEVRPAVTVSVSRPPPQTSPARGGHLGGERRACHWDTGRPCLTACTTTSATSARSISGEACRREITHSTMTSVGRCCC